MKNKNHFCNDVDGNILNINDLVVVLDTEDLEINPHSSLKRGDVLIIDVLEDAESNYIFFKNELNDFFGFYGHRVLKLNR